MTGTPRDNTAPTTEPTAVGEDYLKAIWSATEWGRPPATVSSLATRFGTTRPTVSATLKRLADHGLLRHEPYRDIELTESGARLAIAMVRRHRLIETFLVDHLSYGWDQIHDEAERLEHAVSDAFVDRIDVLLGHPLVDPHGDPIPRRDGTVDHPADAVALDSAPPGRYRILRISDRDPDLLRRAQNVGLTPGRALELDGRHRHDLARALIDLSGIVVAPVLREDADGQPTRG